MGEYGANHGFSRIRLVTAQTNSGRYKIACQNFTHCMGIRHLAGQQTIADAGHQSDNNPDAADKAFA